VISSAAPNGSMEDDLEKAMVERPDIQRVDGGDREIVRWSSVGYTHFRLNPIERRRNMQADSKRWLAIVPSNKQAALNAYKVDRRTST